MTLQIPNVILCTAYLFSCSDFVEHWKDGHHVINELYRHGLYRHSYVMDVTRATSSSEIYKCNPLSRGNIDDYILDIIMEYRE